jgi:hypothetical protein
VFDELQPTGVVEVQVRRHYRSYVLGAEPELAEFPDHISVFVHLDREGIHGGAARSPGEVRGDLRMQTGVEEHAPARMLHQVEEVWAVLLRPHVLVERVIDRQVGLVTTAEKRIYLDHLSLPTLERYGAAASL